VGIKKLTFLKKLTFHMAGSNRIDVAAIEWPANATALVYDGYPNNALVCRTTDPDESKEGATTSEIRIKCEPDQVIGTIVTLPPPSIKTFDIRGTGVKIDVAAIEWPANATALVYELECTSWRNGAHELECYTYTEGAETSEIRIKCEPDQVIGTSSAWRVGILV
jgi:hypothetical protein